MPTLRKATIGLVTLSLLGVLIGVMAREPIAEYLPPHPIAEPAAVRLPPSPQVIAVPHLNWAEAESLAAIDAHVQAIDTFFTDSKKNTRAFADEALGWGSKLRLTADYVPFTSGGRHEKFIRDKFAEHVFAPAQLEEAVRQAVAGYVQHVESIEGQMLVRIRADVADFPAAYPIAEFDQSGVQSAYEQALARAIDSAGSDLRAGVATELVSIITGEALAQVAVRLGVSAGVLGTGAASGWATLGIGVVVGLIVDQVISWVWDWYADPRGNLAALLDNKLDEINRLIVEGSKNTAGLRDRLRQFARERAAVRREAVLSLLQP